MLLVLLTMTLSVFVLPGAAKGDDPSGVGCSPGYWKQVPKHIDSWVGYSATQDFDMLFGVVTGSYMDLLDALKAKGGGENALGRHAVAALLNAAKFGEAYPYPVNGVDGIVDMVQTAYASGDFETAKDLFAAANEAGCPLD
jgi:hypothetical protein